ncbi:MAG TPA: glycogen debranching N-terminal domain-containing protein [Steroidobacteraceae bacterium]|jgi:glycogen debranching enzyme|nr:glycogen debranching N-terminal domain-containing protein [Steroidobacteraceae bacterium]
MSPEVPHQVVTADVPSDERTHSLRQDDCFGLFNEIGDIDAEARSEAGLYRAGVRHLSRFTLTVAGLRPLLLAASPREDNVLLGVNLTNPDVRGEGGRIVLPRGTLYITRTRFIWAGVFHEMIRVRNFALSTVAVELAVRFGSDFENIIDVRAQRRVDAGRARFERVERDSVTLGYLGADEVMRETVVDCHTAPDSISQDALRYRLQIGSRGEKTIALAIGCRSQRQPVQISTYTRSLSAAEELVRNEGRPACLVESSGSRFNEWLQRSTADIGMMLTATPHGRIPAAGLPWLDAAFGRDAIVVALQTLWLWPDIARNVLRYLAATQSTDTFAASGAEPGKILNEARGGDVPPNYFGVDTTPLFVLLAGAYYARTADLDFIGELWPAISQALSWIDVYGDVDGDGYVEARPRSSGPPQFGWKSSSDAVFHADGRIALGPVALCEVQGYVYGAKLGAARIARSLGEMPKAIALVEAAQELQARFNNDFWCADIESFALALDGNKEPCRVRTSNPGHCLYTGIAHAERGRQVIAGFGDEQFFSGWGVRTVAESELRFNPMSYHNGAIWPHDNSLIAAGAARYDDKSFALRILNAQFQAARQFDLLRLPELFCGFRRRGREPPLQSPVACSPQTASAGATFLMLQSVLGITIDALDRQIVLAHPVMPEGIEEVRVRNLSVGEASVDFTVRRHAGSVSASVERRTGKLDLVIRS